MTNEVETNVKCPFFIGAHSRPAVIECEGVTHTAHRTRMVFENAAGVRRYLQGRCCRMAFTRCPIARMLYEKYEEDGQVCTMGTRGADCHACGSQ